MFFESKQRNKTELDISKWTSLLLSALVFTCPSSAAEPLLQTAPPVIHLVDNLDEKDNLGWCIDTKGRGFAEQLQAHSCKPNGGDVQFSYKPDTLQITSVAFDGKCMAQATKPVDGVTFDLIDCDLSNPAQQFTRNDAAMTFSPARQPELCVAVGENSASAGPFMSRSLVLENCDEAEKKLIQWAVIN